VDKAWSGRYVKGRSGSADYDDAMSRLLLIATLFLTACTPTTDVVGFLGGGGPRTPTVGPKVQFEQGGQVVASTTALPSGTFELRVSPGTYNVVVTGMVGGCPGRHPVTVQGSTQRVVIYCNFGG